jgi:catechol 2,3-dioxygenase-like lactoylglutathione lyase family enzyme
MTGQQGQGIIAASTRLHHVGVIQPDMAAAEAYMDVFGHEEDYRGYVAPFRCWCIFLKTAEPGAAAVELVVPDGGPLAKFNKGAGGLHHYAFVTADIRALQAAFAARDAPMLEPEPVRGAGDFLCNFLHPIATRGVIVEYVQPL